MVKFQQEIAQLTQLEELLLSSNLYNCSLPMEFMNLTKVKHTIMSK
jgi:hypothetical protein